MIQAVQSYSVGHTMKNLPEREKRPYKQNPKKETTEEKIILGVITLGVIGALAAFLHKKRTL